MRGGGGLLILLVIAGAGDAQAFSGGISGSSGKTAGMTCMGCHTGGPAPMSATITGPAMVGAGAPVTFTLEVVTGNDAAQVGFDIAASAGTLGGAGGGGAETQVLDGEIAHTSTLAAGGTVQVQFTLTPEAPNSTVTLFAAALRHDPTNPKLQDGTVTATLEVAVGEAVDLFGVAPADMAVAEMARKDEPRWSCGVAAGADGGRDAGVVVALAVVAAALTRRRLRAAGSGARTLRRLGR